MSFDEQPDGDPHGECAFEIHRLESELAWIRKKLELPEDAQMFSGEHTIAGALHSLSHEAHGYRTYITAYRCEDKQGEIARQSVKITELKSALAAERDHVTRLEVLYREYCKQNPFCGCDICKEETEEAIKRAKEPTP